MTTPSLARTHRNQHGDQYVRDIRRSHRRHAYGFVVAALAFAANMAFSALPTPLYGLYASRSHLQTLDITVVYAVYAVGVIGSLYLIGHLSDHRGRKTLLIPALLINVVSAAVFFTVPDLTGLLAARIVAGVGVGLTTATATAYLLELHARTHQGGIPRRAQMVAVVANLCGIGAGPLIAGVLAEYAPAPLRLPYAVFAGLLLVLALLLTLAPETVNRPVPMPRWQTQRFVIPTRARRQYLAAATVGFAAFAVFGLFNSVAPSVLAELGVTSLAAAGALAFGVFAGGALIQVVLGNLTPSRSLLVGNLILVPGLVALVSGVWWDQPAAFVVGGLTAGIGGGLLFRGALILASVAAPPTARAEALAGFFLLGYVGLSVPIVGLGLAAETFPLRDSVLGFALLAVATILISTRLAVTGTRHDQ